MSGCRISKVKFKDTGRELQILPPPPLGRSAAMRGVLDAFSAHGGEIVSMAIVLMDSLNHTTTNYVLNQNDATPLVAGIEILKRRLIDHELNISDGNYDFVE